MLSDGGTGERPVLGAKIQGSVSQARRKCSATAVSVSYREV